MYTRSIHTQVPSKQIPIATKQYYSGSVNQKLTNCQGKLTNTPVLAQKKYDNRGVDRKLTNAPTALATKHQYSGDV